MPKNFSGNTYKNGEIGESFLTNRENQLQCTAEFVPKVLKDLFFVSIVFITSENMFCIHIKQ